MIIVAAMGIIKAKDANRQATTPENMSTFDFAAQRNLI